MSLSNRIIAIATRHDAKRLASYYRATTGASPAEVEDLYNALGIHEQAQVVFRKWSGVQSLLRREKAEFIKRNIATIMGGLLAGGQHGTANALKLTGELFEMLPQEYRPPSFTEFLKGRPDPLAGVGQLSPSETVYMNKMVHTTSYHPMKVTP
ncbi:hypothetical protein HOT36_gp18 [Ralstonia phage RPSC1]|uniref:Uncharacterized protein n=1 Tax=Ralstonia phage RPSC1 TaxID=2041351 RepID=A0A2Z2U7W2_9CAUD|nr:hypothetical protein HOT36_gp18 [Ralstonia phage RPSC1]ATN92948.1 hypothetical protein RPSC1_17 [Ralstonia phage RPSC1]